MVNSMDFASTSAVSVGAAASVGAPVVGSGLWDRLSQVRKGFLFSAEFLKIEQYCDANKYVSTTVEEWAEYIEKTKELYASAHQASDNDSLTEDMVQQVEAREQRIRDAFEQVIS